MKNKLDDILRMMAFVSLLAFAVMGAAGASNDDRDAAEESGLPHLWHVMCNGAFLCEMMEGEHESTGSV